MSKEIKLMFSWFTHGQLFASFIFVFCYLLSTTLVVIIEQTVWITIKNQKIKRWPALSIRVNIRENIKTPLIFMESYLIGSKSFNEKLISFHFRPTTVLHKLINHSVSCEIAYILSVLLTVNKIVCSYATIKCFIERLSQLPKVRDEFVVVGA